MSNAQRRRPRGASLWAVGARNIYDYTIAVFQSTIAFSDHLRRNRFIYPVRIKLNTPYSNTPSLRNEMKSKALTPDANLSDC